MKRRGREEDGSPADTVTATERGRDEAMRSGKRDIRLHDIINALFLLRIPSRRLGDGSERVARLVESVCLRLSGQMLLTLQ
ncbi:hypothetical protein EYF80_020062 [Liparis tanakae]|uniref:Uncharacterized protein n=1 Tax=Liparis tanakae TaxID=230148 RepID=A0A4Z2HVK2_9TELE|nr:hypothetical protein EYF80_020062 [Liparis tanakae]